MSAAIITFNSDHSVCQVIGPFETGQAAADHSATLEWATPRMVALLAPPIPLEDCPYTLAHTRSWCGHEGCREF